MLGQSRFKDTSGTDSRMPVRMSSTQFLLLDSADRNQSLGQIEGVERTQPWNNFSFQKPQALIDAFADHVLVTEVRFPWYIPNITEYNNTIYLTDVDQTALVVPVGNYSPQALAVTLNGLLAAAAADGEFTYDGDRQRFTFTQNGPSLSGLQYSNLNTPPNFYTSASLFKTMGFTLGQSGRSLLEDEFITGNPTLTQYTDYVDIISNRLMRYTSVKDGESASNAQSAVICRIYRANETSTNPQVQEDFGTPFVIYRQFKTPKSIQWNRDSFVDYVDIQVVDQWNNLVPLPKITTAGETTNGSYPDFQISLLCSED